MTNIITTIMDPDKTYIKMLVLIYISIYFNDEEFSTQVCIYLHAISWSIGKNLTFCVILQIQHKTGLGFWNQFFLDLRALLYSLSSIIYIIDGISIIYD